MASRRRIMRKQWQGQILGHGGPHYRQLRIEVLEDRRLLSVAPQLLKDINSVPDNLVDAIDVNEITALGNVTYFTARATTIGKELWKSDGTSSGTLLVKDIRPGSGSSYGSFE